MTLGERDGAARLEPALKGVRVADFTWAWAGPYATMLLALLGAEVIKIESARRTDHARRLSFTTQQRFTGPDQSSVFNDLNLNKLGVTLDLKHPAGVALAKRIVAVSDVVAENMRPGVMERMGLGYRTLRGVKPDIIMLSSSACGSTGPEREYVGYAPTFAALSGLAYATGEPGGPPVLMYGEVDLRSATTSAFAVLAALKYKQRTGKGQHIDLSSQESISVLFGEMFLDYSMNGRLPQRRGAHDAVMSPHNLYRCEGKGTWVAITVGTDEEWRGLCRAMGEEGLAADPRFADGFRRWKNQGELDELIAQWTRQHEDGELVALLQRHGVPATASLTTDRFAHDAHIEERAAFVDVEHPVIGKRAVLGPPWKLSDSPAVVTRSSPRLGEHNSYVFGELLGMTEAEIARLKEEGAIR